MARVANCPQCEHELLIPDGADSEAWAKCPECRAFFQMSQAQTRELASALLVEPSESMPGDDAIPGLEDLSTEASWKDTAGDEDEIVAPMTADELGLEDDELKSEDAQEPTASGEQLEAAAQRIDEWFRSAKTLPDAPATPNEPPEIEPIESADLDEASEDDFAPTAPRAGATLDFSVDDLDNLEITSQDFELGEVDEPKSSPAWDDSQHMDLMLGDDEDEPIPHAETEDATVTRLFEESVDDRPEFSGAAASDDVPDVTPVQRKPRKRRSALRTIFLAVAGAIIGLAAGYLALLWIGGPSADFLQVAELLPPAMLPSSFQPKQPTILAQNRPPQTPAPATPAPENPAPEATPGEEVASETTAEEATDAAPPEATAADEPPAAADPESLEVVEEATETETPAEIQAGYTAEEPASEDPAVTEAETEAVAAVQPSTEEMAEELETPATVEPSSTETALDESTIGDRYADAASPTGIAPAEPAELGSDPAAELMAETEAVAPVRVEGAPSFTSSDLSTALDIAKNAQPNLVKGNFTDGQEVARAKGLSYAALADLAQKATFEADSQPGAAPLQQETDDLFRQTLTDPRIRNEVAVILTKWIASKNRKHGGVFFAGNVTSQEQQGSVTECRVELDGGQTITVLTPSAEPGSQPSAAPQAVVGYILDRPSQQIEGYTGTAKQAIWANHLVPIE